MSILIFLLNKLQRSAYKKWVALTKSLWPDPENRATALFGEAMEQQEIITTGSGDVIDNVMLLPHPDGGYQIDVNVVSDYVEWERE